MAISVREKMTMSALKVRRMDSINTGDNSKSSDGKKKHGPEIERGFHFI